MSIEVMNIPPELQDRLIEVLRTAIDNAEEAHEEARLKYAGYRQARINAVLDESLTAQKVLYEILKLKEKNNG